MASINGILVPVDEEKPVELVELEAGDFRAIQSFVGGTFQCLDLERPDATLFISDEGKINGSELNRRSTIMLWVHDSRFREQDTVAGDALILGTPDQDGNTQSVPDVLVNLLFHTAEYRYLVQTNGSDEWNGNGVRCANWLEAYSEALKLAQRWSLVQEVTVVPSF